MHRSVFTDPNISDGAVRLYGYLCSLRNGASFSDKYIVKALGISQTVLTRRKKELKDNHLILMDKIGPRIHVVYIGYPGMPAEAVKDRWLNEDDEVNQPNLEEVKNDAIKSA